ncbi:MAG TPA: amidohydrolase family protein, partial [Myxococcota bacterium]|nr:amidohydrolase family protein [Myxococcota bacterium]
MSGRRIWIRGARILDPAAQRDETGDLLIESGVIAAVGAAFDARDTRDAERIDAQGAWVAPAFIDLHSHLREPGQEYKEDIASGGRSAVAGGFAAVACMANTQPVNDDPAMTDYIID